MFVYSKNLFYNKYLKTNYFSFLFSENLKSFQLFLCFLIFLNGHMNMSIFCSLSKLHLLMIKFWLFFVFYILVCLFIGLFSLFYNFLVNPINFNYRIFAILFALLIIILFLLIFNRHFYSVGLLIYKFIPFIALLVLNSNLYLISFQYYSFLFPSFICYFLFLS